MTLTATILLPTTGDRGPLLPMIVGCIQRQTIQDFELFIIGDGVDENTRAISRQLSQQDSRIRFFDHPKHPRRGEEYRHAALQEAQGRIVLYTCDRDLWLPQHIAEMDRCMQTANFVSGYYYFIRPDGGLQAVVKPSYCEHTVLSSLGHTLALYRLLPEGWHTTPPGSPTDVFMAKKLLAHPDCRPMANWIPTFLYVKRGHHPGLSTTERYNELIWWVERMQQPHELSSYEREAFGQLASGWHKSYYSRIPVLGTPLNELPGRAWRAIQRRLGWL